MTNYTHPRQKFRYWKINPDCLHELNNDCDRGSGRANFMAGDR
ncbi:hypothetical protein ACF3DV_12245 [Chlorogloeopsis fritschii PCC 9212]|nr:hypothetical protein [Chlorogloeopsis fritschii]